MLNAGADVEQRELSFMLAGMQNATATLEHSLAVSYKNILPYDPVIGLLGIYPQRVENMSTQKSTDGCL